MKSQYAKCAAAAFGAAILAVGPAFADDFYYRVRGNVGVPPPTAEGTASISPTASVYRSGIPFSWPIATSLNNPSWGFVQQPQAPSLNLLSVGSTLSGSTPDVPSSTIFNITGQATSGGSAAVSDAVSVTVHPKLAIVGGAASTIKGKTGEALPAQDAYALTGLIGTKSFSLLQNDNPVVNLQPLCAGLAFSISTGQLSGVPTVACNVANLTVRATDSFDGETAFSNPFAIEVEQGISNALAWGGNSSGNLGIGAASLAPTAERVLGGSVYVKLAAGNSHTCGIVTDGSIECWGGNSFGELGDGTTTSHREPTKIPGISGATDISAGKSISCAVANGAALCWGYNNHGQLGTGDQINRTVPTQVGGLESGVTGISAGTTSCAVVNGGAKCWGYNNLGQVGDGTKTTRLVPFDVKINATTPLSGVSKVAVSPEGFHACAIANGGAHCWGYGGYGQLGDNTTIASKPYAVPVSTLGTGVTDISLGLYHTCAVASGSATCWGNNNVGPGTNYGQLGDGTTTSRSNPGQVIGLTDGVTRIASYHSHTCAIVYGATKCWGISGYRLGDGLNGVSSKTPVQVLGAESGMSGVAVSSSGSFSW